MTGTTMRRDQTEDENIFTHNISDDVLELPQLVRK